MQVGRVLMVSRASLKPKNARFNNTSHDFEIFLERNSTITPCEDDAETAAIPMIMFNVSVTAGRNEDCHTLLVHPCPLLFPPHAADQGRHMRQ